MISANISDCMPSVYFQWSDEYPLKSSHAWHAFFTYQNQSENDSIHRKSWICDMLILPVITLQSHQTWLKNPTWNLRWLSHIYIQMENLHLSLISLAVSKTKQQRAQELACLLRHRRWPGRPRDSLPNWSAWWFGIPTPLKNMSSSVWVIIPNIWKVIKILLIIFSDCWTTWFIWLVVGFYPSEKSWSSSVGMILPNSMKNKIHVPNHQAVIYYPPK